MIACGKSQFTGLCAENALASLLAYAGVRVKSTQQMESYVKILEYSFVEITIVCFMCVFKECHEFYCGAVSIRC